MAGIPYYELKIKLGSDQVARCGKRPREPIVRVE